MCDLWYNPIVWFLGWTLFPLYNFIMMFEYLTSCLPFYFESTPKMGIWIHVWFSDAMVTTVSCKNVSSFPMPFPFFFFLCFFLSLFFFFKHFYHLHFVTIFCKKTKTLRTKPLDRKHTRTITLHIHSNISFFKIHFKYWFFLVKKISSNIFIANLVLSI